MDSPFAFEKIAAGRSIIDRKKQIDRIKSTIFESGKGISLYDTPRSGKETIVREVLEDIRQKCPDAIVCEIDLFNIRSWSDFFNLLKIKMKECYNEANKGAILPFDVEIGDLPAKKIAEIPQNLAQSSASRLIIYIKEFQNITFFEDTSVMTPEALDKIWSRQPNVSYILTGSSVWRMKELFEKRRLFYSCTVHVDLPKMDKRKAVEFISSSFLYMGRVIENEETLEIYNITGGNMWYIKQICSMCCAMPAGYINRKIVNQAIEALLSVHSVRFRQTLDDLTSNQINLLRAINDGVTKFSSADILESYKFNSSANVFRIKEALEKKDVITFDDNDIPHILDPLFEYWLKHYYFSK